MMVQLARALTQRPPVPLGHPKAHAEAREGGFGSRPGGTGLRLLGRVVFAREECSVRTAVIAYIGEPNVRFARGARRLCSRSLRGPSAHTKRKKKPMARCPLAFCGCFMSGISHPRWLAGPLHIDRRTPPTQAGFRRSSRRLQGNCRSHTGTI